MDGTLLDRDHFHVPPRNIAALRAAAAKGIKIAIATGRNLRLLEDAATDIGVIDYVISANGAGAIDWRAKEWLYHVGLPDGQWQEMLRILHTHSLPVETYADGESYLTRADLEGLSGLGFPQVFCNHFASRVNVVEDVVRAIGTGRVEKLNVFRMERAKRPAVVAALRATGEVVIANGEPTNLEMTAPGAEKDTALRALCDRLGAGPEEVMAFGDGDNDVGMLSWAGMSFAMDNASPGAKKAAKHLAPSNGQAGVAQMIEKYLLDS